MKGRRSRGEPALLLLLLLFVTAAATGQTAAPLFDAVWLGRDDACGNDPGRHAAGWELALGQGRLFGVPELPLQRLRLARQSGLTPFVLGWQRCGRKEGWHEDAFSLVVSLDRRQRWGAISSLTRDSGSGSVRQLSLVLRFRQRRWSLVLIPPVVSAGPPRATPLLRLQHRDGAATLALQIERGDEGTLLPTVAWWPVCRGRVGWGLRCETATGQLGLLLAVGNGRPAVRTAILTHPALGATTLWDLRWRWGRQP